MSMSSDGKRIIAIIGGGGHAKVVIATAEAAGYRVVHVFDDDPVKADSIILSHTISAPIPDDSWWLARGLPAHIAVGDNLARSAIASRLCVGFVSLIHPRAWVHDSVNLGTGTLVCAGAIVHPDAVVGSHCIINTGAIVEHDCRLGDGVHIAPRACLGGGVEIGTGTLIGAGAIVILGRTVGSRAVVGAGAVVISDIADGERVAGMPARPIH